MQTFNPATNALTVTQLNQLSRDLLEEALGTLTIQGEISGFTKHRSGHWYFTLKDEGAQIACAMFRQHNLKVKTTPQEGQAVFVQGKVSIYEQGGRYQLIAYGLQETGLGKLQLAFAALKEKLEKEGLFAQEHKKPFPPYPKKIGIVTSEHAAALQDMLSVLRRRYPIAELILYKADVQGKGADKTIVKAIERANQQQVVDVLIVARGGGSIEDLWNFNEESVARSIFQSEIPIITGIGHEVDFTIADFVADTRAPTPSVAAETITPLASELQVRFGQFENRLQTLTTRYIEQLIFKVENLEKRLISPQQRIAKAQERCQHLYEKLVLYIERTL